MSRALRAWGPALLFAALIFAESSRSTLPVELRHQTDKLAHFAAYAVLGLLLARALWGGRHGVAWAAALGWLYGISDEVHQHFVPGRSADVRDWVADALGVVAGILLYHQWRSRRGRSPSRAAGAAADSSS